MPASTMTEYRTIQYRSVAWRESVYLVCCARAVVFLYVPRVVPCVYVCRVRGVELRFFCMGTS